MPRFLIDEDLPFLLASLLRQRGHAADHIQELKLRGSSDARVYAAAQERQASITRVARISALQDVCDPSAVQQEKLETGNWNPRHDVIGPSGI